MDNVQLFIAVGVPSFLVLINIWATHRLDGRMDQLTKDMADIRVSLANLRAELYEKFEPRKIHA